MSVTVSVTSASVAVSVTVSSPLALALAWTVSVFQPSFYIEACRLAKYVDSMALICI